MSANEPTPANVPSEPERAPTSEPRVAPPIGAGAAPNRSYTPYDPWSAPRAPAGYPPADYPPAGGGYRPPEGRPGYPGRDPERRRRVSLWIPLAGGCLVALGALVALVIVAVAIAGGIAFNQDWSAQDTTTRTLSVTGTPNLVIEGTAGDIQVVTGGANQVIVQATKHTRDISHAAAQRDLADVTLMVTQSGNTVTVDARQHGDCFGFCFARRTVDLMVTVPPTTNTAVTLTAGNLDMDSVAGTFNLHLSAGNAHLRDMQLANGSTVDASAGNIELTGVTFTGSDAIRDSAGNVILDGTLAPHTALDVVVSAGNVVCTLPASTPAHLDATASLGNVTVGGFPVTVERQAASASASGDLSAQPIDTLTMRVSAGSITLTSR